MSCSGGWAGGQGWVGVALGREFGALAWCVKRLPSVADGWCQALEAAFFNQGAWRLSATFTAAIVQV
jgi:hypothetical protein